jgi:hypothetical protein
MKQFWASYSQLLSSQPIILIVILMFSFCLLDIQSSSIQEISQRKVFI